MSNYLVHRRIKLKANHLPTGRTRHTKASWSGDRLIRGTELPVSHELVIAQLPRDEGFYLLYLDENGSEITDTYHDTMDDAVAQANWEFNVGSNEWV